MTPTPGRGDADHLQRLAQRGHHKAAVAQAWLRPRADLWVLPPVPAADQVESVDGTVLLPVAPQSRGDGYVSSRYSNDGVGRSRADHQRRATPALGSPVPSVEPRPPSPSTPLTRPYEVAHPGAGLVASSAHELPVPLSSSRPPRPLPDPDAFGQARSTPAPLPTPARRTPRQDGSESSAARGAETGPSRLRAPSPSSPQGPAAVRVRAAAAAPVDAAARDRSRRATRAQPPIEIVIDRIDVRVPALPPAPQRQRETAPQLSLADYLSKRDSS